MRFSYARDARAREEDFELGCFEEGLVERMRVRWGGVGVEVERLAAEVQRGVQAGKVHNANGCLITACRREAERLGSFGPPARSARPERPAERPAGSYAEFRWRLIGAIMRERMSPGETAGRLRLALGHFPGYQVDLEAEARLLASCGSWASVGQATSRG